MGKTKTLTIEEAKKINKEDIFKYLDTLLETGAANMFGAVPYLREEFNLPNQQCSKLLSEWMNTYSERHPE